MATHYGYLRRMGVFGRRNTASAAPPSFVAAQTAPPALTPAPFVMGLGMDPGGRTAGPSPGGAFRQALALAAAQVGAKRSPPTPVDSQFPFVMDLPDSGGYAPLPGLAGEGMAVLGTGTLMDMVDLTSSPPVNPFTPRRRGAGAGSITTAAAELTAARLASRLDLSRYRRATTAWPPRGRGGAAIAGAVGATTTPGSGYPPWRFGMAENPYLSGRLDGGGGSGYPPWRFGMAGNTYSSGQLLGGSGSDRPGSVRGPIGWPLGGGGSGAAVSSAGSGRTTNSSGIMENKTAESFRLRQDTEDGQRAVVVQTPDGRTVLGIDNITGEPRTFTDVTALEMSLSEARDWRLTDIATFRSPTNSSVIITYPYGEMHIARDVRTGQELVVPGDNPLHISAGDALNLGLTDYMPIVPESRIETVDLGPSMLTRLRSPWEIPLAAFDFESRREFRALENDRVSASRRAYDGP